MVDNLPELPTGASRSGLLCPSCLGGRSGERSLSVGRFEDGAMWYKCHRNTCGYKGRYGAKGVGYGTITPNSAPVTPFSRQTAPFTPRPYPYALAAPRSDHWIWSRVGWGEIAAPGASQTVLGGNMHGVAAKLGLAVREDAPDELVWEVRGLDLEPLGMVSRRYPEKVIRTWRERPGPWMGYFRLNPDPVPIWIVEDPVSAARIALTGKAALCLFGTHLGNERSAALVEYLRHRPGAQVRVALDPDAAEAGAAITRDLTFFTGRDILFCPLRQDIKDLSSSDFLEVISR